LPQGSLNSGLVRMIKGILLQITKFIDSYMSVLFCVMVFAGIIGGAANYCAASEHKNPKPKNIFGYIFIGIAASFTVPFLLNIFSSSLLEDARIKPVNLYVFTGICIISAFFLSGFIGKIYISPLQRETAVLGKPPGKAKIGPKSDFMEPENDKSPVLGLSDDTLKILKVFAREDDEHALSDILKKTGLPEETVNEELSSLMARGVITQKLNEKNRLCLSLTLQGQKILGRFL